MGLFDFLKKTKAPSDSIEEKILNGAEDSAVLIPNHAKIDLKVGEEKEGIFLKKEKPVNRFKVSGLYDTGTLTMLSGVVECGKLKKKMKAKVSTKDLVIADLKVGSTSVEELLCNEEGSIFVKSQVLPMIKYGDILEFK